MSAVDLAQARAANGLRGRYFVSAADLGRAEIERIFGRSIALKAEYLESGRHARPPLAGKTLAMLFQHPSLRTRVTFEAGMTQLGGHAIYLAAGDVGLGLRESVSDVARNLDRFVDGIMARLAADDVVRELAARASIPVINAMTDREHPCQALADILECCKWELPRHCRAVRVCQRETQDRRGCRKSWTPCPSPKSSRTSGVSSRASGKILLDLCRAA